MLATMIISHEHKFIFIKTKKTAGTSFEIALSRFCGPQDVITRNRAVDEELRRNLGGRGPQNHKIPLWKYNRWNFRQALRRRESARFVHHSPAREVIRIFGREIWDSYYTFCFERNPWDKAVSYYYWRHPSEPRPSMMEFLTSGEIEMAHRGGWHLYTLNDQIVVDDVYHYENLTTDVKAIAERLRLPEVPELPHAKGGIRADKRHYRDILSESERDKVAEIFAAEIDRFGYEF